MYIEKYLKRLNIHSEIKPNLETLLCLHRQHLYNIPFENLDIHSGRKIILETGKLLHKIIDEERGGFCYELNGAFYSLLKEIGFNVKMISARVYYEEGKYSPEFDHMALIVNINDEEYLADVGFGDSFIEPIKFHLNEIQEDVKDFFRISQSNDDKYFVFSRSGGGEKFIPQYKFSLTPRELNDFIPMCEYHQTSYESHFKQKIICSKATETGRISLSDLKFIITENGTKEQREITTNEFHSFLQKYFSIRLKPELIFPQNLKGLTIGKLVRRLKFEVQEEEQDQKEEKREEEGEEEK